MHPDGSVRWVAARGRVLCDPDGRPVRMLGAAYDTTDVHSAAERLGRVLETMSTAFFTLDRDWRFTYVNAEAERILLRRRDELVGNVLWDLYTDLEGTESDLNYRGAMESGTPTSFEQYYPPLDTYFDVRATPNDDGLSVYFHDISNRVRAEQEREAALEETGAATGRLQILSAASARLAGTLDVDELLRILGDVVLNGFGDGLVIGLDGKVLDEARSSEIRIAHATHLDDPSGTVLLARLAEEPLKIERFGARTAVVADLIPALARDALGAQPALALPLMSRGRMLGAAVVIGAAESALDRRVLVELAARAGVALDNAVLFGSERRLALALQRSLLPTALPSLPGIELAARYLPGAGGQDVGGDFYLGHALEDGRLLLVIGDVMGHGPQAAARMGQLRAVLAAYAYDGDPPDRVLAHVSMRATTLLDLPMATALAAIYDPAERRLTFSLAGHLPPLVAPLDGPPAFVAARPGPPLGTDVTAYERHTVEIPEGATIVLYTDGLIEDRTRSIDVGLEQLRQALIDVRLPPEEVCDHVLRELGREAGGVDDIALLVMHHRGVAPSSSPASPSLRSHSLRPRWTVTAIRPSRWWRERTSSRRSAGSGTGNSSGFVASPSISTRQRAELARICHSPWPARATVRASGGASVTSPSGVHATTAVGATPWIRPPAKATPSPWPHHQWSANAAPQFFSA